MARIGEVEQESPAFWLDGGKHAITKNGHPIHHGNGTNIATAMPAYPGWSERFQKTYSYYIPPGVNSFKAKQADPDTYYTTPVLKPTKSRWVLHGPLGKKRKVGSDKMFIDRVVTNGTQYNVFVHAKEEPQLVRERTPSEAFSEYDEVKYVGSTLQVKHRMNALQANSKEKESALDRIVGNKHPEEVRPR